MIPPSIPLLIVIKIMGVVEYCVRPRPKAPILTTGQEPKQLWTEQAPIREPEKQGSNPEEKDSLPDGPVKTQSTITVWQGIENKKGPIYRTGWNVKPQSSSHPPKKLQRTKIDPSPMQQLPTPNNEPQASRSFEPLMQVSKSGETDHNADRVVLMSAERRDFSSILISQVKEEQVNAYLRIQSFGAIGQVLVAPS